MILYGPPGTGKTGFVKLLPGLLPEYSFATINATTAGVSELKKELDRGADRLLSGGRHIVVVDEIHTWSKNQQEVLLGAVESGQIVLLGLSNATPYGVLIPSLASRVLLFPFHPLEEEALKILLARGVGKLERERGCPISLSGDGESIILRYAGGDGRRLLSTLEGAVLRAAGRRKEKDSKESIDVTESDVLAILQNAGQHYGDKDTHYDVISAFIKSVRNYEVDAALHWLARMLEGGEDPLYIARRLVILASEDIGLADPHALTQAVSCYTAVSQIGLPEGRIPLSLTTIYLSLSPKSVSAYRAIDRAISEVRDGFTPPVPVHLRDRTTKRGLVLTAAPDLEYLYPPDLPGGVSPQSYLPGLPENGPLHRYYHPEDRGRERELKERYEAFCRLKNRLKESL
jgi:putative ATPase